MYLLSRSDIAPKYHCRVACLFALLCAWLAAVFCLAPAPLAAADDRFAAGYATAILEREFSLKAPRVTVSNGVMTVRGDELGSVKRDRVLKALSGIQGVVRIEIIEPGAQAPAAVSLSEPQQTEAQPGDEAAEMGELFPRGRLFAPLIADPRWPRFSAAYHYYIDDDELDNVGATSFGETLVFYRDESPVGGLWEIGIQAGVFAIFDLDAESKDLINADYWVGIPLSYRYKDFSALFRLFHQSSHLGDEFLLRNRLNRVNLSYEGTDLKLSYDISDDLRLYAGGGYIFRKEPSDLKPWSVQYGVELRSPRTFLSRTTRPLFAADFKNWEENDWNTDVSVRLGLEFERPTTVSRRFQIMLEYFNGSSPNGQFYNRTIEYMGLGAHFYF